MSETKKSSGMDWLLKGKSSIDSYLEYAEVPIDDRVKAVIEHMISTFVSSSEYFEDHSKLANRIAFLIREDEAAALYNAFQLGLKAGADINELEAKKQAVIKKSEAAYRKRRSLDGHQFANKSLKGLITGIAINSWKKDFGEHIRVGEMTKVILLVLPKLKEINVQLARQFLTGESEQFFSSLESTQLTSAKTVRKWITSVAPAYAKHPGRPRNSP